MAALVIKEVVSWDGIWPFHPSLLCQVGHSFSQLYVLSAKGKVRPQIHYQVLTTVYAAYGAEKHHVCFFSCVCAKCFVIPLFSISRLGKLFGTAVHHPSGCEYCITRADQDFSTIAGLAKLVLCGVGQMALLFIYSLNCVLKNQYESY